MSMNEPSLIRIYQGCSTLMNIKRRLFAFLKLKILPISPLNEQKVTSSSKVYMCLKKIVKQAKNHFSELSYNTDTQSHIKVIEQIISNLKNNSEFLTQQEKLIIEANKIIQNWNQTTDPVVYYQQQDRAEIRKKLNQKLLEIHTFSIACRQTKKPLYVRKLERELKDNLCLISESQRKFNYLQYNTWMQIRKKMVKLLVKILEATSNRSKDTLVYDQKTLLLSKYIDVFYGKDQKLTKKIITQYRKDLNQTISNISLYIYQQKQCFDELLIFIENVEQQMKLFQRQFFKGQDIMTKQIFDILPDMNHIVSFQDILYIVNSSKNYFLTLFEWSDFKGKLINLRQILQDSINFTNDHLKNIEKRQNGSKNIYIQQFIQDKKFLQNLTKKYEQFQINIFSALNLLLDRLLKNISQFERKSPEREEINKIKFEKSIAKIFENYFRQTEKTESHQQGKSIIQQRINLSLNQQKQVDEIEHFINKLVIYERQQQMGQAYQCSLGPRLLIHGRLKLLQSGILYVSSFNKKNIFFGKTIIFIPKQQIFQINKQSAFIIFPDVIEVITKKGGIYFHALGKRQEMFEQFNNYYFPEANVTEPDAQQIRFHEFKGDAAIYQQRMNQFMANLESEIVQGQIPNITLKSFFYKYYSQQQFVYQGVSYKNFNHYSINLAGGTNIDGTAYTPGIPYYFKLSSQTKDQTQTDILQSERFFTYKKEVPMIPFVSKGGYGICQQKTVYRWGGPFCFVAEIYTTVSGYSLTQGMLVKTRLIFKQKQNKVCYRISGQITFQTNSAINGVIRSPAFNNLKSFLQNLYQIIKKLQKHKKIKKSGKNKGNNQDINSNLQLKIQQLQVQNLRLKLIIKRSIVVVAIIYIVTIIIVLMIT